MNLSQIPKEVGRFLLGWMMACIATAALALLPALVVSPIVIPITLGIDHLRQDEQLAPWVFIPIFTLILGFFLYHLFRMTIPGIWGGLKEWYTSYVLAAERERLLKRERWQLISALRQCHAAHANCMDELRILRMFYIHKRRRR